MGINKRRSHLEKMLLNLLIVALGGVCASLQQSDLNGISFRTPGDRFSLKCDRPGTNTVVMMWYQELLEEPERKLILQVWATEPSVNEAYKARISFSHRNQSMLLDSVTTDDSGFYYCELYRRGHEVVR